MARASRIAQATWSSVGAGGGSMPCSLADRLEAFGGEEAAGGLPAAVGGLPAAVRVVEAWPAPGHCWTGEPHSRQMVSMLRG